MGASTCSRTWSAPFGRLVTWVAGLASGILYVVDAATGVVTGQTNLGGDGAQSGDGLGTSGMVLTSTATPQS